MTYLSVAEIAAMERGEAERAVRERAQTAYLGDGTVLARVLGRNKIFLDASDQGFACHLMLDGFWEMWATLFCARFIKPGMHVIDVGANFGYYTLLFGDCVGQTGRVLAIEPNPLTAARLRQTVLLNGHATRTQVIEAAAGETAGSAIPLFAPDGEPKNATVMAASDAAGGRHFQVSGDRIDTLASSLGRVDFVKIDTEGAEHLVLAGMTDILTRYRPGMLLEFNAAKYPDPAGLVASLLQLYGTIAVLDGNGTPVSVDAEQLLQTRHGDDWLLALLPPGYGDASRKGR